MRSNVDSDNSAELVTELRARVRGAVLTASSPGFDTARRIWNGMFDDTRPLAVVRCADAADCAATLRTLDGTGVPIAIRGGGHHVAGFGTCHDGVVLDLGGMRGVSVDAVARTAQAQAGATLHDLDIATSVVGQAVPLGVVSETGVAGLALSGGIGWLSRLHGYTCDNLLSAHVVTVGGEVVNASDTENADLLWGLRGGGGNFGVVTDFEFQTHPVDVVHVAEAWHRIGAAVDAIRVLDFFRRWTDDLPDHTTVWGTFETATAQHHGALADETAGGVVFGLLACAATPNEDDARRVLEPMLRERNPARSSFGAMRLVDLQHAQDTSGAATRGMHVYMKGEVVERLSDGALEGIAEHVLRFPTRHCLFEVGMLGGELARRDELGAAVGMRSGRLLPGFAMMASDGTALEERIAWARSGWGYLRDGSAGGVYLNFNGADETGDRILASLAGDGHDGKRARLLGLKRRWDPANVLHRNHNIDPGAAPAV
jgi:FAD/FMN-containing dehydrogenase